MKNRNAVVMDCLVKLDIIILFMIVGNVSLEQWYAWIPAGIAGLILLNWRFRSFGESHEKD